MGCPKAGGPWRDLAWLTPSVVPGPGCPWSELGRVQARLMGAEGRQLSV